MVITLAYLIEHHACSSQIERTIETFGVYQLWEGIPITRGNLHIARNANLDITWLAKELGIIDTLSSDVGLSGDTRCNCSVCRAERAGIDYEVESIMARAALNDAERKENKPIEEL
jgi:hypothetical protein